MCFVFIFILLIYFSDHPCFSRVYNLSLAIAILIGLIGGVRGFIKYIVRKTPLSLEGWFTLPKQQRANELIQFTDEASPKRIWMFIFMIVSISATIFCVYGVLHLVSRAGEVSVILGKPFLIEKPGLYTLWSKSDNFNNQKEISLAEQFQIQEYRNNNIVSKQQRFIHAVNRRNGEKYLAICEYRFLDVGAYCLLSSALNNQENCVLYLQPSVSYFYLLLLIVCFILSFISLLWVVLSVKQAHERSQDSSGSSRTLNNESSR